MRLRQLITRTLAVAHMMVLVFGQVLAHATLVLGTLHTDPNPPRAGEPFILSLELADPTRIPIEDAVVVAEFTFGTLDRNSGGLSQEGQKTTVRLEETSVAGN